MESNKSNSPIPFVDNSTIKTVTGNSGYKKPSYSNIVYGINKITTQYILVTPEMLKKRSYHEENTIS